MKRVEDDRAYLKIEADQRRLQEEHASFKSWLAFESISPEENYEAALSLRQPGTSSWFLEDPGFLQWVAKSNGLMWVYGIREYECTRVSLSLTIFSIADCGKTVLSYVWQSPSEEVFTYSL